MWDYDHGKLPDDLNTLFITRSSVHSRNLRNVANQRLYTSTHRNTIHGTHSLSQVGSILLNELKDFEFYNANGKKLLWLDIKIIYSANINNFLFLFYTPFLTRSHIHLPPLYPSHPTPITRQSPIPPPTLTQPPTYLFLTIPNIHSPF